MVHENGIVETPHGHVKRRLEKKLILRGICDLVESADSGELLDEVFSALNAPRQRRYQHEVESLSPLPAYRFADYELLTVRVRSTCTIELRQVVYSVPPSLIGRQVAVRLHQVDWSPTSVATGPASSQSPMALMARFEPGG